MAMLQKVKYKNGKAFNGIMRVCKIKEIKIELPNYQVKLSLN